MDFPAITLGIICILSAFFLITCLLKLKKQKELTTEEIKKNEVLATSLRTANDTHLNEQANSTKVISELKTQINELAKYTAIVEADVFASKIRQDIKILLEQAQQEAIAIHNQATIEATEIRKRSNSDIAQKQAKIDSLLLAANRQSDQIINEAHTRAEQIAGDAYQALKKADELEKTIKAMKNVINGYGDEYLKPTFSILDELAETYSFDDAGQQLKAARTRSKLMIEHKQAATCNYVEAYRRDTAIRFVADAFNGKVDSILSRTKTDNVGKLEAEIRDAYSLVNLTGDAFRNARITPEYLEARLSELNWLVAIQILRENEKEEQRRIREQIREEEKAQREIERALKEAAKEEEALQKAMVKMRIQIDRASAEQRAEFEVKLAELQNKLIEAEERNQRAISMAQQTRTGHVYVISNIGSFGENVYKIGMTRRLEPLDRVKELGDASVPFEFDVHAMIWSEDAPRLEHDLHKNFLQSQVNKVNPRKEFFRLPLNDIRQFIESHGMETSWTMAARAAEYKESLAIEKQLKENPTAVKEWLDHQEDIAPTEFEIEVDAEKELIEEK